MIGFDGPFQLAQLPPAPPSKLWKYCLQAQNFGPEYSLRKELYHLQGFDFSDAMGDGLGSDAKLHENGNFVDDGDVEPTDHWARDYDSGTWVGKSPDGNQFEKLEEQLRNSGFFFDKNDIETYSDAMLLPPFLLDKKKQFYYGVGSRMCVKMFQLHCATTCAALFNLDNRGRPRKGMGI